MLFNGQNTQYHSGIAYYIPIRFTFRPRIRISGFIFLNDKIQCLCFNRMNNQLSGFVAVGTPDCEPAPVSWHRQEQTREVRYGLQSGSICFRRPFGRDTRTLPGDIRLLRDRNDDRGIIEGLLFPLSLYHWFLFINWYSACFICDICLFSLSLPYHWQFR